MQALLFCEHCRENRVHREMDGKMRCTKCGTAQEAEQAPAKTAVPAQAAPSVPQPAACRHWG